MHGERFDLVADSGGRLRSFVEALQRFPDEPKWCVVGGFAVTLRIADVHRFTNDLDTVSRSQQRLVDALAAQPVIDKLAEAKLRLSVGGLEVDIDIMSDASDDALPLDPDGRAFAQVRRMALRTSEQATVSVVDNGHVAATTQARIATTAALVAMKAVAIPRRLGSNSPAKIGSDIHDLFRLTSGEDYETIASAVADEDEELCHWVGLVLVKWFSPDQDLRYTAVRLQRYHPVTSITEDDLAPIATLGHMMVGFPPNRGG